MFNCGNLDRSLTWCPSGVGFILVAGSPGTGCQKCVSHGNLQPKIKKYLHRQSWAYLSTRYLCPCEAVIGSASKSGWMSLIVHKSLSDVFEFLLITNVELPTWNYIENSAWYFVNLGCMRYLYNVPIFSPLFNILFFFSESKNFVYFFYYVVPDPVRRSGGFGGGCGEIREQWWRGWQVVSNIY